MGEGGELFGTNQRKRNELCWQLQGGSPLWQAAVGPLFSEPLASHTGIQAGMPIKPISLEIHVL